MKYTQLNLQPWVRRRNRSIVEIKVQNIFLAFLFCFSCRPRQTKLCQIETNTLYEVGSCSRKSYLASAVYFCICFDCLQIIILTLHFVKVAYFGAYAFSRTWDLTWCLLSNSNHFFFSKLTFTKWMNLAYITGEIDPPITLPVHVCSYTNYFYL